MNADIRTLLTEFFGDAISTIVTEVVLLGLIGAVFSVLAVLLFKIVMNAVLGEVKGKWNNTWKAVWLMGIALIPIGGAMIGSGEGLIRGCERALRDSEFGRKTVPAIAQQSVYLYAAVYFADPATLEKGKLTDITTLSRLDDVRAFANGSGELDTERLDARMQELEGRRLADMALGAQDDFAKLAGGLGDDFKGIKTASKMVTEYAVRPQEIEGVTAGDAAGPLFAVRDAANLDGNPDSVTRDELAEHLQERVAIPGLLAPIKLLVRPWQWGAAIVMLLLLLLMLLTRFTVAGEDDDDDVTTGQED